MKNDQIIEIQIGDWNEMTLAKFVAAAYEERGSTDIEFKIVTGPIGMGHDSTMMAGMEDPEKE